MCQLKCTQKDEVEDGFGDDEGGSATIACVALNLSVHEMEKIDGYEDGN